MLKVNLKDSFHENIEIPIHTPLFSSAFIFSGFHTKQRIKVSEYS